MIRNGLLLLALAVCVGAQAQIPDETRELRIVSLAPHLTELAFAAGAGAYVVATVEHSDYPPAARRIPRIGDAFRVDLERVLAVRPHVVLAWESGTPMHLVEQLRGLGLNVETISTQSLAHVPRALRRLGELAGTRASAERAAAQFEHEIAQLRALYRERAPISVFLEVNAQPLYTVNGKHILSEVATLCGGKNVFAALPDLAPAIGVEAVIAANPQAIVSSDASMTDAAERWSRWRMLRAVQAGNVFSLSADELSRATPRLAQGARSMCRALDTARANLGLVPHPKRKPEA
ncbi:MAG: cobalamin-binding protein [Gammaproteobacteria bacterium]|nr:cobalamin-binding protein [Gammaproteobacteria bacterium]